MSSYLSEVYENIVGSPREQAASIDWERYRDKASAFQSALKGSVLSKNPKKPGMSELIKQIEVQSVADCHNKSLPWIQKWYYPEGKRFSVFLSHDVDEISWSWRRKLLMGARHPSTLTDGKNHYWGFDDIMKLENELGFRSTFFVVAKSRHKRDPPYGIDDISSVCNRLKNGGWEIGLHGSYLSYNNMGLLQEEMDILQSVIGENVAGTRQHYVNFDPSTTFRNQDCAGFVYDSTIGFNEISGFASGICHPYVFEGLSLMELPLMVMDGQLFWHENMNAEGAVQEVSRHLAMVERFNGMLTLDWHQRSFDRFSFRGWADAYKGILNILKSKDAFIGPGKTLVDWWKRRENAEFERRVVSRDSVEWHLVAHDSIEGLNLRILVPESQRFKAPDVQCGAEFSIDGTDSEIWIRFGAIPNGERIIVTISK